MLRYRGPSFLLALNCFRENQMGFEQVFNNLTFKGMDTLTKRIQSHVDYVLNHSFLDTSNRHQMLTMYKRIESPNKSSLVALISTRGITLDSLHLSRSSSVFTQHVVWGSLTLAVAWFSSLKARSPMNFQPV